MGDIAALGMTGDLSLVARHLFWVSAGLLIYTYAAFPALAMVRGLLCVRPVRRESATPFVTIVVPAYNEARCLGAKLQNLGELDYPVDRREIVVASDGSTDDTVRLARACGLPGMRVLDLPRQGKNATLNAAVAAARGDIFVFTDADALLTPAALRALVAPFADPVVGGVAGDVRYIARVGENRGERAYWDLDRALRRFLSTAGSVTSASGQLHAVRRDCFHPVPPGLIDDFYISTNVVRLGRRLVFEPRACATHPVASTEREFGRKVRNLAIGFRGVWTMRALMNPFRYGFYALQFTTHKLLRRLMFAPLALLVVTAAASMSHGWPYAATALIGFILLFQAGLARVFRASHPHMVRLRLFALPFYFVMVNIACARALVTIARGDASDRWEKAR